MLIDRRRPPPGYVGRADRWVRRVLGVGLLGFAVLCGWLLEMGPALPWASASVGALLLVTAWVRLCPIYRALGITT